MIQRHYSLSCFILEHLSKVQYFDYESEIVDLIDGNNIYSFKLPNAQHYEKIATEFKLQQVKHIGSLWFFLDQNHTLIVQKKNQQLYKFQEIEEIVLMQGADCILVLLRETNFCKANQLTLKIGAVIQSKQSQLKDYQLAFNNYNLEEQVHESDSFNKYVPNFKGQYLKVQKIMSKCCLLIDDSGERQMINLMFNDFKPSEQKVIKFKRLFLPLSERFQIISVFHHYLLIRIEKSIMIINAEGQKITNINELQILSKDIKFLIYNNFIIILLENKLTVYELLKGNKMAEININSMLQQFEQGSTLIINKHENSDSERYQILHDYLRTKLTHFFLFDKQKLTIYYFNLNKLLERGFIKMIKENLKGLESDDQKYHENVIKTINFRMKKLDALEKYIADDFKINNFGNSIRFLINQHTPYILSDGLSLFHNAITTNLSKLLKQKGAIVQLQRDIIKLCHRLVVQSSYEMHIANGLQILNSMFTNFRKFENNQGLEKNKEGYTKLIQTSRISKLLKNQKKKKLFELSYELVLKIKGYKYLQGLTNGKIK